MTKYHPQSRVRSIMRLRLIRNSIHITILSKILRKGGQSQLSKDLLDRKPEEVIIFLKGKNQTRVKLPTISRLLFHRKILQWLRNKSLLAQWLSIIHNLTQPIIFRPIILKRWTLENLESLVENHKLVPQVWYLMSQVARLVQFALRPIEEWKENHGISRLTWDHQTKKMLPCQIINNHNIYSNANSSSWMSPCSKVPPISKMLNISKAFTDVKHLSRNSSRIIICSKLARDSTQKRAAIPCKHHMGSSRYVMTIFPSQLSWTTKIIFNKMRSFRNSWIRMWRAALQVISEQQITTNFSRMNLKTESSSETGMTQESFPQSRCLQLTWKALAKKVVSKARVFRAVLAASSPRWAGRSESWSVRPNNFSNIKSSISNTSMILCNRQIRKTLRQNFRKWASLTTRSETLTKSLMTSKLLEYSCISMKKPKSERQMNLSCQILHLNIRDTQIILIKTRLGKLPDELWQMLRTSLQAWLL